jgi:hypothetical protein
VTQRAASEARKPTTPDFRRPAIDFDTRRDEAVRDIWAQLTYLSEPERYEELSARGVSGNNEYEDFVIGNLNLNGQDEDRREPLAGAGIVIEELLTTTKHFSS